MVGRTLNDKLKLKNHSLDTGNKNHNENWKVKEMSGKENRS